MKIYLKNNKMDIYSIMSTLFNGSTKIMTKIIY